MLTLTYSADSLALVLAAALSRSTHDHAFYIESLDGTEVTSTFLQRLKDLGLVRPEEADPIMRSDHLALQVADDDSICPGYDTIWVFNGRESSIVVPKFYTWYACEGPGHLPRSKDGSGTVSWAVVENWMSETDVLFGVSQGYMRLLIEKGIDP